MSTTETKIKSKGEPEQTCCCCFPLDCGVKVLVFFAALGLLG